MIESVFSRSIQGESIKHFQNILLLLHKINKEFSIERSNDGTVMFRSLNDTKSVFITIEFNHIFWGAQNISHPEEDFVTFSCKLLIKAISTIFKNIKKIQNINIYQRNINNTEEQMVFEIALIDGVKRSYYFTYQECEILNAICDGHNSTSLQTQPKVFTELIDYLHQSPEILIDASKTSFSLKSSYPLGGRANDDTRRYYITYSTYINSIVNCT